MVITVHMAVGINLCLDQDFFIPSRWIIVTWRNLVKIRWVDSHLTDLK